jgi:hypothetical protein
LYFRPLPHGQESFLPDNKRHNYRIQLDDSGSRNAKKAIVSIATERKSQESIENLATIARSPIEPIVSGQHSLTYKTAFESLPELS